VVLSLLAGLIALACAAASVRRLAVAVSPTSLDPRLLVEALSKADAPTWVRTRDRIIDSHVPWESELFAAFAQPSEVEREAGASEQLLELDWQTQRLARVPRVCASVSTSAGFFFASLALLTGLAAPEPDTGAALTSALDALTLGIAGTSFCVAVHLRARRAIRERLTWMDRLIERLRALSAGTANTGSP
jgi:hypothetical protein